MKDGVCMCICVCVCVLTVDVVEAFIIVDIDDDVARKGEMV